MSLHTANHHLYEPMLGIVLFEMRDREAVVHCIVSEWALRNRARVDGEPESDVEDLFSLYQDDVETIASKQYEAGFRSPIVRALDLSPLPVTAPKGL